MVQLNGVFVFDRELVKKTIKNKIHIFLSERFTAIETKYSFSPRMRGLRLARSVHSRILRAGWLEKPLVWQQRKIFFFFRVEKQEWCIVVFCSFCGAILGSRRDGSCRNGSQLTCCSFRYSSESMLKLVFIVTLKGSGNERLALLCLARNDACLARNRSAVGSNPTKYWSIFVYFVK